MKEIDFYVYREELLQYGIEMRTLYSWQNGERRPSYENLILIAHIMNLPIGDLVKWFAITFPRNKKTTYKTIR